MKHLTIRDVPPGLARALEKERRRSEKSLNQTVKDLLARALGLGSDQTWDNGLGRFAGTWSEQDLADFEKATEAFERVDEEQWR